MLGLAPVMLDAFGAGVGALGAEALASTVFPLIGLGDVEDGGVTVWTEDTPDGPIAHKVPAVLLLLGIAGGGFALYSYLT